MASITHYSAASAGFAPNEDVQDERPGFIMRALYRIMDARQREADRLVARYLEQTGGRLTEDAERAMERRTRS